MPQDSEKAEATKKRGKRKSKQKKRTANLLSATESAIDRLEQMTRPGGEIETMDIKDLKSLISSIKDLTSVSAELDSDRLTGGVVVLPEVRQNE